MLQLQPQYSQITVEIMTLMSDHIPHKAVDVIT